MVHIAADSDMATLSAVAAAAEQAATLMPANSAPGHFDTMPEFQEAFDQVDAPVSRYLRERLIAIRPAVAIVDELSAELPDSEVWVLDAIDGAIQYMQGLPQWSISIALIREKQPVLAALHSPLFGETYTAAAGYGAYRNGVRVSPSTKTDVALTLIGTSQPPFAATQPQSVIDTGLMTSALLPHVGVLRNLGPTSWQVADVASGRMDAFWECGHDVNNLLAASLIAREAGAVVTDVRGHSWHPRSDTFLAAGPGLHAKLLDILAGVPALG